MHQDVVCTGDSDAFLFGAKAVVRDICLHKAASGVQEEYDKMSALQKHCSPSYADIVAFCDRHMAWPADVTARYIGSKLAERDLRRLLLVQQAAEICVTPGKEASREPEEVGGMLDGVRYRVGGIVKERWVAGHRMFEVSWTGQPEVENSVVRAELLTRVHPEMVQAYEAEKEAGRKKGRRKQQKKAMETREAKEKETMEKSEFMTGLREAPINDACGGYTEWEDETEYQQTQGVAEQPVHTDNSVAEWSRTLLFSVTNGSSERISADAGTSADLEGDREPFSRLEPSLYDQLGLPSRIRQIESDQAALSSAQNHDIQARGAVHQMKKIVESASHEEDVVEAGRQEVGVLKRCQKADVKPVESRSRGAVKSNENGLLWVWQQEDYPPKEQQKGKRSRVHDRSAVQNAQQRRGGPLIDLTNMTTLQNDTQNSTTAVESVGISNGGKAVSDCIDLVHLGNDDSPGGMRGRGQAGGGSKLVRRDSVHGGPNRWVSSGKHEVVDLDTPESVTVKVALRGNAMLQEAGGGCLLASKLDFAVLVPSSKKCIRFIGTGPSWSTIICFDAFNGKARPPHARRALGDRTTHVYNTYDCATVQVEASGITMVNIVIVNQSRPGCGGQSRQNQAVAFRTSGDEVQLHGCWLRSWQATLYAHQGRQVSTLLVDIGI
ncbi:unnamed protein product [Closterium sp. Yama58-4]|nr:unnamed protein product [Closterium sp. Yama58-4]